MNKVSPAVISGLCADQGSAVLLTVQQASAVFPYPLTTVQENGPGRRTHGGLLAGAAGTANVS